MGPPLPLELLRLLVVSMSLGWGSGIGRGGGAFGEDAPFEELSKGELRGGISERDISRVAAVAGAMFVTEVCMQLKWDRMPKGVFDKTQLKKLRDRELRGRVSGDSNVWRRRGGVQRQGGAGWSSLCRGILC